MGIMLVYDITQEKSFENIKNWIRNIEENASADVEKMLLGNKCELNEKRQVNTFKMLELVFFLVLRFFFCMFCKGLKRERRAIGCRIWNKILGNIRKV